MAEFFRRFMPRPGPMPSPNAPRGRGGGPDEVPRGVGSGFIITADGYVLTNHHVVNGADEIIVTMTDRREFKARLIGSDERTDVALLKVEASGLPRLSYGHSWYCVCERARNRRVFALYSNRRCGQPW
jgi:serine protease Do